MNTNVERAVKLLFPETGRRAKDIKFFFAGPNRTVDELAQQVVVCFEAMKDDNNRIQNID